ncbi:uncharacterized protein V1516DRAFT_681237 [Lipomyces oligophaga]|uniref:uncharacterized protein n=1 Tax=Lipomyces oligophaga TaxID=45792 RepID=UPI0034CE8B72
MSASPLLPTSENSSFGSPSPSPSSISSFSSPGSPASVQSGFYFSEKDNATTRKPGFFARVWSRVTASAQSAKAVRNGLEDGSISLNSLSNLGRVRDFFRVRILLEVVLVLYLVSLFIKFRHYGSLTADKLYSLELPLSKVSQEELDMQVPMANRMKPIMRGKSDYPLNVFLVNTPNYHFEVYVPIIETFRAIDNVNITLVSTEDGMGKWGLRNAVEIERGQNPVVDALKTPLDSLDTHPDFMFMTTCPEDMRVIGKAALTKIMERGTHVVCVVHEAHLWDYMHVDQYSEEIAYMRNWIQKDQWHFATLSPHVHTFVRSNFPRFMDINDRDYRPLLFHPVFNLPLNQNLDFNSNQPFAVIPGKFESERRDYNKIFSEYESLHCDINLRLIGSGKIPQISDGMRDRIGFITNLNFFEYFQELSKGVAIIPTLGNEHYYKSQASSTVSTSVVAGTPLIATTAFLYAHSQIPVDAVWLQGDDESELEVLTRVGRLPASDWVRKKNRVMQLRYELMTENVNRCSRLLNIIGEYRYGKAAVAHAGM